MSQTEKAPTEVGAPSNPTLFQNIQDKGMDVKQIKDIRLINLHIENFKGINSLDIKLDGEDLYIFGDNATGKTTIFDAVTWLLFERDSEGKAQFDIKPLDENGEPVHGLENYVEGVFSIDGNTIALKKLFKEKWTKKRGQAKKEFTGHTTTYFINGVPTKKKEYLESIKEIATPEQFQLLTDPRYFCSRLKWTERRKVLLEMFVSKEDLAKIEQGEKDRKVLSAQCSKINEELQAIPIRIDEAAKAIPDVKGDLQDIKAKLEKIDGRLGKARQKLVGIENGGVVAELQKKLSSKKQYLALLEKERLEALNKASGAAQKRKAKLLEDLNHYKKQLGNIAGKITACVAEINGLKKRMDEKRNQWYAEEAKAFDTFKTICPTCGQDLPQSQIEAARSKFNRQKAAALEQIQREGKQLKAQFEDKKKQLKLLIAKKARLEAQTGECEKQLGKIEEETQNIQAPTKEIDAEIEHVQKEIESIGAEIEQAKAGQLDAAKPLQEEIDRLEQERRTLEDTKNKLVLKAEVEKRIEELKAEERKLATEYEKAERKFKEVEDQTRLLVSSIEDKIAAYFQIARFKLFHEQINGGLQDVCEVTVNGVPYGSLNNAARINAGLDVINILSRHYGLSLPIFVDNAESVTSFIPTDSQMILLVVSPTDKALRIEKVAKKEGRDERKG